MKNLILELKPEINNSRKSFYGKANVIYSNDITYLKSYDTIMASVKEDGLIHRHSDYRSVTTSKHLKSFISQFTNFNMSIADFYTLPLEEYEKPILVEI